MPSVLNFGASSTLELDLPSDVVLADCAPRGEPLDDPAAATLAALLAPLDYPPLDQATVPGDRVALVLDDELPNAAAIVAGAVRALLRGGVSPENIAVVQTLAGAGAFAPEPLGQLPPDLAGEIRRVAHDPAQSDQLAYLAASRHGEGVYLNRALCDADLVLPLGCLRLEQSLDYRGLYAALFPAFSDEKAIQRFLAVGTGPDDVSQRRQEADEIGWLLGIRLMVQVVPGGGDKILHVLAGDVDSVQARGRQLCEATWGFSVPHRASLVLATIEGGPAEQTWSNVARAIAAAGRAVAADGAIALCTDLDLRPGPALMRLADAPTPEDALVQIRRDTSSDAGSALQLAEALSRGPVYLLSRLDEEVVEELGVAPVTDTRQLARLASRSASCILLSNAQYAVPTAADE